MANSGHSATGLILPEIKGPEWLTGGQFGIEASVAAVILCLLFAFIILKSAVRENQILAPIWRRNKEASVINIVQTL